MVMATNGLVPIIGQKVLNAVVNDITMAEFPQAFDI